MRGVSLFVWIRRTPVIPVLLTVFLELASSYIVRRDTTPYFIPTPTNVTVEEGDTAMLKCYIGNLGPKMVNVVVWRKIGKDVPLTIGEMRFAPEATELTIDHSQKTLASSTWNLLIKNVQQHHAGIYECQVTANHLIAQNVQLNVIARSSRKPALWITGTEYVDMGKQIHIICNASGDGRTPTSVDWFFEGNRIHPSNPRWKGRLEILRQYDDKFYISELIIHRSTLVDKGAYVCRSSDLLVDDVKVHVLKDASKDHRERDIGTKGQDNYKAGEMRNKPESTASSLSSIGILQLLTFVVLVRLTR